MPELLAAIHDVASGRTACKPHRIGGVSPEVEKAVSSLATQIQANFPGLTSARWVALRLLDGDTRIAEAIRRGELGELEGAAQVAVNGKPLEGVPA
jgi:ferrous iron transport protein B